MKVKWHTKQLLNELEIYKPIFERLSASISVSVRYYHHPYGEIERVVDIIIRRRNNEYSFSVSELRTKSGRRIWVEINPAVMRRKVDDEIRQVFRWACRSLIARIARDIILSYDPELWRAFYCIVTEENTLMITFLRSFAREAKLGSEELMIPLSQLSEQRLLQEVTNLIKCTTCA
jgi:hypothetical protein